MPPTWSVLNHCAKFLPLVSSVLCLSLSVVEVASTSLHASFMLTLHSGSSPSFLSSTGPKWTWMFKYWKLLIKFGVSSHKQASKHTHRADKRIGRGGGEGQIQKVGPCKIDLVWGGSGSGACLQEILRFDMIWSLFSGLLRLFLMHAPIIHTCKLPSSSSSFTFKSTTYWALANGLHNHGR